VVDSGALQCGGLSPPHTPIFVSSSASLLKGKGTSGEVCLSLRQEDSLHQKGDRDRARVRSSPASESSATRSSLITILLLLPVFCRGKERFKGRLALGVLGSEDPEVTNQPCPSEGSLRENKWRYDRRGRRGGRDWGPGVELTQSLPVFCLQQPGLQWVRSFFCYQSSLFSRHHGQILRQPRRDTTVTLYRCTVKVYSCTDRARSERDRMWNWWLLMATHTLHMWNWWLLMATHTLHNCSTGIWGRIWPTYSCKFLARDKVSTRKSPQWLQS